MEPQQQNLTHIEERLASIEIEVKKTKKYVLIMLIGTIAMALLPIILGAIMVPFLMSTLGSMYSI
jgi:hypothetical protein